MFYKKLFTVNIHHGYFLDSGEKKFLPIEADDDLLNEEEKEIALKKYHVDDYIKIVPTDHTSKLLKNYRLLLCFDNQGFSVVISTSQDGNKYEPLIYLEETTTFTFEIQATEAYFNNYTELVDINENSLYLFSNQKPIGQSADFKNIFDSNGGLIDTRFLLTPKASQNLLHTLSEEDTALNTSNNQFSLAYMIQLIEEDENLTPQQKSDQVNEMLLLNIQEKKRNHIIGYIRLSAKGDGTNHFLEFDSNNPNNIKQYTLNSTPTFTLSFVNKKTFWRYNSLLDAAILTTKEKKWSVKNGYIQIKTDDFNTNGLEPPATDPNNYVFPNPRVTSVKKEGNDYYSEIFI